MVVWAEIPYITEHMTEGRENTKMPGAFRQDWGYFSIKDKMGEISQNAESAELIADLMRTARASRGDVAVSAAPNPMMQKMLDHTTVEGLVKMAAGAITPEMVVELNQKLCKIRK